MLIPGWCHLIVRPLTAVALAVAVLCLSCVQATQQKVVVYTSVDQHYAEPILAGFERETGIAVRAVYDVEAAKTTGLVNRLLAEQPRPQADVWWNGEFMQTILLAERGVLAPAHPEAAKDLPSAYCDADGLWYAFAARARVLLVNTDCLDEPEYPQGLMDLLDERWPAEQVGMAMPLFGTSATHAAALSATLGQQQAMDFYTRARERGVCIEAGNSVVRDKVVAGDLWWGLTDTDDALGALERGAPVALVFPDQDGGRIEGTLRIPGTVALIKGCPHPQAGGRLVNYLLSPETEAKLIADGWCQLPVLAQDTQEPALDRTGLKVMELDLTEIYNSHEIAKTGLTEIFAN